MSIPRKIANNVVISSTAKILSTIVALVGIGLITRYLGQDGFGKYTTTLAFLGLFTALGDWGLYQISTREISRPKADEEKIMNNTVSLRLLISIGITILVPIIVGFLPYPRELKLAIVLVSFSYIFSSFYQVLIGLFQKRLLMGRVTIAELCGKIIQVILLVIGVKNNWGFYFIVVTLLINMFINFLVIYALAAKFIKIKLQFDRAFWKTILTQSLPVGLSAIVTFVYFKADAILLSFLKPAADVGIYGAAYKVIENASFFPSMIVGLTMPMFSYHVFDNREKFKLVVNKNFKVFLVLVIPLVIGTWFLADGMINIIAGEEFRASASVLRIIIVALAFIFFGHLFNNILIAAKLQQKLFYVLLLCAAFNITANLIFIPRYSYYATATTSVLTEFLVVVLSAYLAYKNLGYFPKLEKLRYLILSGLIMAGYLWLLKGQNFFLLFITSPIIYFGSLIAFKVISKGEIQSIISRKPQLD